MQPQEVFYIADLKWKQAAIELSYIHCDCPVSLRVILSLTSVKVHTQP